MASDTTKRLAKGAAWNVAANIAKIASGIVILPILTRILSPSDFGLLQMAMPIIVFSMVFNNAGVGPALVRADHCSDELWSSALWANIGIGAAFTLILIAAAPAMGAFYGNAEVVPIIVALSAAVVVQTAGIVPGAWLQREFAFRALALSDIVGHGLGVAIAVAAAFAGHGVWALVYQQLVTHVARTMVLWFAAATPVRFVFRWSELKEITGFSINVNLASVANFFGRNADNIVIGRQIGAQALGYYSIAYRLMLLPIQVFSWGLATILLPGLSQMKYESDRLRAACMRVFKIVSLVTFPIMAGACALSEPLIVAALGEKMRPAAPLLAILAPVGAMQSLSSSHGSIFMALGRADILFRWSLACNVVIVVGFILAASFGVAGVAAAYLISNLLLAPPGYTILFRLMNLSWSEFVRGVGPIAFAAIAMGAAVWSGSRWMAGQGWSDWEILFLCVPAGAALYGLFVALFSRGVILEAWGFARSAAAR